MTFKIGDKVTCVSPCGPSGPQEGKTYTVKKVRQSTVEHSGGFIMELDEIGAWFSARFVLASEEPKTTPHKWAKEIKAWADGAAIEWRYLQNSGVWTGWWHIKTPVWETATTVEYRVKPEKKPDNVVQRMVVPIGTGVNSRESGTPNVQYTFDGETGKLKAVQLLSVS